VIEGSKETMALGRKKVLALLSGGLDSTLAVKISQNLGLGVEAVHFTTPFCICDKCSVQAVAERFGLSVHDIFLGEDFLDLLVDPPHGYGSQMNICIDCRILMFKKGKDLADKVEAEYLITGEVLNERPFSQRLPAMRLIEKEAGLEGRVLRPLSGRLLPETELEREGLVERKKLYNIRGRSRKPQIRLADELDIRDYPCPSGGCLLTDPQFAKRLRDHITYEGRPTLLDIALLRHGRHFRINGSKIIVGRNEGENHLLSATAENAGIPHMSVMEYVGPVTLIKGEPDEETIIRGAAITVRYSDAPRDGQVDVKCSGTHLTKIKASAIDDRELDEFMI